MKVSSDQLVGDNFELGGTIQDINDKFLEFRGQILDLLRSLEKLSAMHGQSRDYYLKKLPAYVQKVIEQVPQVPIPTKEIYVEDFYNVLVSDLSMLLGTAEDRNTGLSQAKELLHTFEGPIDFYILVSFIIGCTIAFWVFLSMIVIFVSNRGVRVVSFGYTFVVAALIALLLQNILFTCVVHSGCNQNSLGKFFDHFLVASNTDDAEMHYKMNFQQLLDRNNKQHELIHFWYSSQEQLDKDTVVPAEGIVLHYRKGEECIEIAPRLPADSPLYNDLRLIIRVEDWSVHLDISGVADFVETAPHVYLGFLKLIMTPNGKPLRDEAGPIFKRLEGLYTDIKSFNDYMTPLDENFARLDEKLKSKFVHINELICQDALLALNNVVIGITVAILALVLFLCLTKWIRKRLRARTLIWDLNSDPHNQASEYI